MLFASTAFVGGLITQGGAARLTPLRSALGFDRAVPSGRRNALSRVVTMERKNVRWSPRGRNPLTNQLRYLGYSQPPLRGFPALTYGLFPTVFTDPCQHAKHVPAIRQEKAKRFAERTATIGSETAMNFRPSYETSIEGYESGSYSLTKLR